MENDVLRSLTYGLFVLSVHCGKRDNACIINTAIQTANTPDRIVFSVNKGNLTCEMLDYSDDVTLSVVSEDADFDLFRTFGFVSGRETEKFDGFDECERVANGTLAVTRGTNAWISAQIEQRIDLGSHVLFIAVVTDGKKLSSVPSATYAYYHTHIKPAPQPAPTAANGKKRWRCAVCGWEYEGDELPADLVCPVCKHPASDFELV